MFVNVSPASLLCDETVHVLKFGAVAQEIIIQPDRDASIADMSISQFAPPLRPSRFQQYVRKSISILSARGASVLEPSFLAINEDDDSQDRIRELEEELALVKANWEDNEQKVFSFLFSYFTLYFLIQPFLNVDSGRVLRRMVGSFHAEREVMESAIQRHKSSLRRILRESCRSRNSALQQLRQEEAQRKLGRRF